MHTHRPIDIHHSSHRRHAFKFTERLSSQGIGILRYAIVLIVSQVTEILWKRSSFDAILVCIKISHRFDVLKNEKSRIQSKRIDSRKHPSGSIIESPGKLAAAWYAEGSAKKGVSGSPVSY